MPKFQIVSPHDPVECLLAIGEMAAHNPELMEAALLGCHYGDHTAYAVIEASGEEEARSNLPDSLRKRARVSQVESFDIEEFRAVHDSVHMAPDSRRKR